MNVRHAILTSLIHYSSYWHFQYLWLFVWHEYWYSNVCELKMFRNHPNCPFSHFFLWWYSIVTVLAVCSQDSSPLIFSCLTNIITMNGKQLFYWIDLLLNAFLSLHSYTRWLLLFSVYLSIHCFVFCDFLDSETSYFMFFQ